MKDRYSIKGNDDEKTNEVEEDIINDVINYDIDNDKNVEINDKKINLIDKKEDLTNNTNDKKRCKRCNKIYPESEFVYRNRKVNVCNNCRGNQSFKSLKIDVDVYNELKSKCKRNGIDFDKVIKDTFRSLLEDRIKISEVLIIE